MMRRLLIVLGLLLAALPARAAEVDLRAVAADLAARGDALMSTYDPADGATVGDAFSDLYFEVFEASGMEQAIGAVAPDTKTELESHFSQLIGKAAQGRDRAEVAAAWNTLRTRLIAVADERAATATGPLATFVQSILILVREGFEAMLVVTALVTYLRRSGQGDKAGVVWQGVAWAALCSLAAAWLLGGVLEVSGQDQEVLEGGVMLVAAIVLFYVSFWLLSKRETAAWQGYVRAQVEAAAADGKLWTLGLASFLAVFREGAETVLFYQALALSAPGQMHALLAGIAAGTVVLMVLFAAMRTLSFRLPLAPFFTGTAALLFVLAVSFAGKGVLELQEGRLLPVTPLDTAPRIEWLGVFPTLESLAAQLLLVLPMAAAVAWAVARRRSAA